MLGSATHNFWSQVDRGVNDLCHYDIRLRRSLYVKELASLSVVTIDLVGIFKV